MAGINDADFGIASNRGWRFGNFGTLQLRVKPDGQLITRGTITPGISSGFAGHINSSGPIKFVNGSAAQEIYVRKIRASASWATNDANDPGDGGGFFSGNLIVNGTITGNLNGNASTATRLQTARSISLGGALGGSTTFDGSANVTINASINSGAVGTAQLADGAVTAAKLAFGAALANLGYTPVNKAGDTMSGQLTVPSLALSDGSARINFGDKRTINVYVDHGGDTNTRYYYLGKVGTGNGILKVQGIMGGHAWDQGRANVDVQFSARDGFRIDGEVIGKLGQADIWVYAPSGDSYIYLYLVTNIWALVNLELSAVGMANIEFNGTFSYFTPAHGGSSTPSYKLSIDTSNILRYTAKNAGAEIPVSYAIGSGINTNGSFSFGARAYAMGPFALIAIYPTSWGASPPNTAGFGGEGVITLYMSLSDLRSVLALNSIMSLNVFSVQLTLHATQASIYNDNIYQYLNPYYDSSTGAWGIQIYRGRVTSSDTHNLVQALILAHFSWV
jgi:hypothetical protein